MSHTIEYSDGHQYLQNKQSPLVSYHWIQWWSPISTKQVITSCLIPLNKVMVTNINKTSNHLWSHTIEYIDDHQYQQNNSINRKQWNLTLKRSHLKEIRLCFSIIFFCIVQYRPVNVLKLRCISMYIYQQLFVVSQ